METLSPHEILGISPNASEDEIKAAYRALSRRVHSDVGGSDALFRQVQWAYDSLIGQSRSAGSSTAPPHDERSAHEAAQPEDEQSGLGPWVQQHPSLAAFLGSLTIVVLGLMAGSAGSGLSLLGLFGLIVGVAGLLGTSAAREASPSLRGWDLWGRQVRLGLPRLLKVLGVLALVIAALFAAGAVRDHHGDQSKR